MYTVPRALEEALFQHFIYQKMDIAYAIDKPFPFVESLRDKAFITNRMYKESLEACRNLVPVSKVVHNILTKLEKTFSLSLLVTLFSEINLHEYPSLVKIFKSFKSVMASYGQWSRATPTLLEVPTGPAEGCSLQTLPLLPPPPPPPPSCPLCVSRGSEPGASSQRSNEILGEPPSSSDPAVSLPGLIQEGRRTAVTNDNLTAKMNEEEDSHKMSSPPPGTAQASSDNLSPQIKDEEDSQEMPHAPPGPTPVVRDESLEPNDPKEPQEVSITPSNKKAKGMKREVTDWDRRRLTGDPNLNYSQITLGPGTALPGQGTQEKLQVVDQMTQRKDDSTRNLKVVTRTQKTRTEFAQTSRSKDISDSTSEMNKGKKSQETPSTPPTATQEATSPGHGIQEKLPVVGQATQRKTDDSTCNSKIMTRAQKARSKGKRKKGTCSSLKTRFQKNIGRREKPKDDSMDFQCPDLPMTCDKEKAILHVERMKLGPSKKCIQNEEGVRLTAKEFEMKGKGRSTKDWKQRNCEGSPLGFRMLAVFRGLALCRPYVQSLRTLWGCAFCRTKASSGSQQCHRESKIPGRQMQLGEQLIQDYDKLFKEAMWLDPVKERLIKEVYTVVWFVWDMRLIFHNHKTFYKASNFGQIGLDLEAEFEKDLKEMLGLHEA
uniref:SP110 nuclear body protein n=1 Tax=Propithecus coquereli TaxID=379532 RepID=A0A2K6ELH3_PROCO